MNKIYPYFSTKEAEILYKFLQGASIGTKTEEDRAPLRGAVLALKAEGFNITGCGTVDHMYAYKSDGDDPVEVTWKECMAEWYISS